MTRDEQLRALVAELAEPGSSFAASAERLRIRVQLSLILETPEPAAPVLSDDDVRDIAVIMLTCARRCALTEAFLAGFRECEQRLTPPAQSTQPERKDDSDG